jgi:hypothetical protein
MNDQVTQGAAVAVHQAGRWTDPAVDAVRLDRARKEESAEEEQDQRMRIGRRQRPDPERPGER